MQTTLSGKGSKCRVCTHPERNQIESLLGRGAGISAVEPLMREAFSRRALYRHRAKHMIAVALPAARPVPFPHSASSLKRVRWLQREIEHTAALAEYQGNLSLKLKALHELGRFIWLEERLQRSGQDPVDVSPGLDLPPETLEKLEDARRRREDGTEEARLDEVFRRSDPSYKPEIATTVSRVDSLASRG
jgi:hypothetical protein